MNAAQRNLFEMEPTAPIRALPTAVDQTPRQRRRRAKQPTLDTLAPKAFAKSLKQKYREPRGDLREEIAGYVLIAAERAVQKKFVGCPSDRDDVVSEVVQGALPRAYKWKRGGTKSIEQYAYGCCLFAFYDVMRERNAAQRDDALDHKAPRLEIPRSELFGNGGSLHLEDDDAFVDQLKDHSYCVDWDAGDEDEEE